MSPADFAATALRADVRGIISVERIKHGLTNQSWLVTLGQDQVVVRISNTADVSLQIDRDSEAAILRTVAAAGIGPEVLLCEPRQHVLVTRYLGPTWTERDIRQPANISRLAATMRRLHALSPPAGVHRVRLVDVIDRYVAALSMPPSLLHEAARQAAQALDAGGDDRLCHTDVHALNIIDDGAIRLIDWEYAGLGPILFDLASTCVFHHYDRAQRTRFFAEYSQRDDVSTDELDQACRLFDYIRELWMRVRQAAD